MYSNPTSFAGPGTTVTGRRILVALVATYIIQLVLEQWLRLPLQDLLAWSGPSSGRFQPWQPVTAFLINGPGPMSALFDWLILYFFWRPAEEALGRRGLFRLLLVTWLAAVLITLPLLMVGAVNAPMSYLGLNCFLTGLLVVFGLCHPSANILLFFVLPIPAWVMAWGTGLVSFLFFLYLRSVGASVAFFGWVGAMAWMYLRTRRVDPLAWIRRRWRKSSGPRPKGQAIRFPGGGRSDDDTLYH